MFIVTLPYSREKFTIPVITFRDIFNLSRLRYDKNAEGYVDSINNLFKCHNLSIIDKFFVLLKARQFFVSENISLNFGGKNVSVNIGNFTNNLFDIDNKRQVFTHNKYTIELDIPYQFIINPSLNDIYESIVRTITIGDQQISLSNCSVKDRQVLFELLPPTLLVHLKKFIMNKAHNVLLFSPNNSLEGSLSVNFVTSQPYEFISALFSDYDLYSCREILFCLSKRMNCESILNSTVSDISVYLTMYNDEIKRQNNSSNTGVML